MQKAYRIVIPLLLLWLVGWMLVSWPAIQDDALIHMRYADNLYLYHTIEYQVLQPSYGASSLLYVSILALLRAFSASPDLPRATSTFFHVALFAGLASLFVSRLRTSSKTANQLGLVLLVIIATPSAVRWLDDGMETGFALGIVVLLCWLIFRQLAGNSMTARDYFVLFVLGFFACLLRIELLLLCSVGFLILFLGQLTAATVPQPRRVAQVALQSSHLLLGGLTACLLVTYKMHVLLPDTAVAKSLGASHWRGVLNATVVTLTGSLSFGMGMLFFWLLTLLLVYRSVSPSASRRTFLPLLFANSLFPVVLTLSVVRGQEIQGVRYFAWTFFFSILWNILSLGRVRGDVRRSSSSNILVACFLVLLLIDMPFEIVIMDRVLDHRASTMRLFESQHLERLHDLHGTASDIGYIGYFTGAHICDLAGLVNGRSVAKLSSSQRATACAQSAPQFFFGNVGQMRTFTSRADLSGWQICGSYDFVNVRTNDTHYLAVPPAFVSLACQATGRKPLPIASLFPSPSPS